MSISLFRPVEPADIEMADLDTFNCLLKRRSSSLFARPPIGRLVTFARRLPSSNTSSRWLPEPGITFTRSLNPLPQTNMVPIVLGRPVKLDEA